MGEVVDISDYRGQPQNVFARWRRNRQLEVGDRWAERHNPHSPMNTAPLMQPGRDAGSIADVSPAAKSLRDCILDLVGFAKTGGPSLPDGAA